MSARERWQRFYESSAIVVALYVVFAIECVWMIGRNSAWFDESYSILLVRYHSLYEIARRTSVAGHPPLWYWSVKPWLTVFGPSIIALRSMSTLWMFVGLGTWFYLLKTRFSRSRAVLTLAIAVTNPMMVHYAVEGRMYALSIFLCGLTSLCITSTWRWRWFAYWPLAVCTLYIHYFLAFVIAGQFLFLLIQRREQKLALWWLLVYGASIVAAFAPWIPLAAHQTKTIMNDGFWIPPISPATVLHYVEHAFLHRVDHDLEGKKAFLSTLFLGVFAWLLARSWRDRVGPWLLPWCLVAVPWLCLWALSCKPLIPIFHPRYVLFTFPALLCLLAAGALALSPRARVIALVVLFAGQIDGFTWMRWVGMSDPTRNWHSMKWVARTLSQPVDGEQPWIVTTYQFALFDAKATLGDDYTIKFLLGAPPKFHATEAIFYDKPDWWILDLNEVKTRHFWLVEQNYKAETTLPPGFTEIRRSVRNYVIIRLIERTAP